MDRAGYRRALLEEPSLRAGRIIRGKISIRRGAVVEGNWDDYEPLRMGEEPEVLSRVLKSSESIGGIGEPGVPPVAPALVNAIAALAGKYATSLPLDFRGNSDCCYCF